MNRCKQLTPAGLLIFSLPSCSPEIGSDAWCKEVSEKEAGGWTTNEALDYTKNCLLKDFNEE